MPRVTMSTRQAAVLLGCERQNVDYLYRRGHLKGPDRAPRTPILLWADSVEAWRQLRRKSPPGLRAENAVPVGALTQIDVRLANLELAIERLELRHEARSTAVAAMLGVHEELRTALVESDRTADLLLEVSAASQESKRALTRADTLRDEVIRQLGLPASPDSTTAPRPTGAPTTPESKRPRDRDV